MRIPPGGTSCGVWRRVQVIPGNRQCSPRLRAGNPIMDPQAAGGDASNRQVGRLISKDGQFGLHYESWLVLEHDETQVGRSGRVHRWLGPLMLFRLALRLLKDLKSQEREDYRVSQRYAMLLESKPPDIPY
ncbi:hypothetical protein OPQ81_005253 [Rhizoctonia solani]|nr:hypothetical protein OPQ81_011060 [Rhizoctonia solani]KAJ1300434.1 hypothetical protein OPQ81_005253 [Rhizoctonia solani]